VAVKRGTVQRRHIFLHAPHHAARTAAGLESACRSTEKGATAEAARTAELATVGLGHASCSTFPRSPRLRRRCGMMPRPLKRARRACGVHRVAVATAEARAAHRACGGAACTLAGSAAHRALNDNPHRNRPAAAGGCQPTPSCRAACISLGRLTAAQRTREPRPHAPHLCS
jgi:hypothetical protein